MKPQQSARYCHFSEYFHEASKSGGLPIVVDDYEWFFVDSEVSRILEKREEGFNEGSALV
jgi:hypothetical protein